MSFATLTKLVWLCIYKGTFSEAGVSFSITLKKKKQINTHRLYGGKAGVVRKEVRNDFFPSVIHQLIHSYSSNTQKGFLLDSTFKIQAYHWWWDLYIMTFEFMQYSNPHAQVKDLFQSWRLFLCLSNRCTSLMKNRTSIPSIRRWHPRIIKCDFRLDCLQTIQNSATNNQCSSSPIWFAQKMIEN